MADQVQWRGGTTLEHAGFTGAPREITVDTDKKTLVVHDGVTAGGHPLARQGQVQAIENRFRSLYTGLPTTDIGPIIVAEVSEVWVWVSNAYFTGYRSPLCGRPIYGHTTLPLPGEIDAVGGLLSKTAYAGLWAYAQENGLVTTQALWASNVGGHYFADVSSTQFRVPDLRNQFLRYTGTDADNANARTLGSRQLDALQNLNGTIFSRPYGEWGGAIVDGYGVFSYVRSPGPGGSGSVGLTDSMPGQLDVTTFDASIVARTSSETRPINTAYAPRIHV